MQTTLAKTAAQAWRLQDAKSQFSALVENALLGVPQHVSRRGKRAVVVVSERDFETLQRSAANQTDQSSSFIEHLLAIPKEPAAAQAEARSNKTRLDVQPRIIDFS